MTHKSIFLPLIAATLLLLATDSRASLVTTVLGSDAGPVTLAGSNFTDAITISGLTTKPINGGDSLILSMFITATDVNDPLDGTVTPPPSVNVNSFLTTLSGGTNAINGNFVRRGNGAGNFGEFYGTQLFLPGGGGFAFQGFDDVDDFGITDALTGQISDTFEFRMTLTNALSGGSSGFGNFDLTSEVFDVLGNQLLPAGAVLTGVDLTNYFDGVSFDAEFGTANQRYYSSATFSDASVTIIQKVPEPTTFALFGMVVGFSTMVRRRRG